MSDLIERKKAIDALCGDCQGRCIPCESYPCSEVEVINALPSAQPKQRWIPVSERLPEVGRSVLFSRRSMGTREGCLQADGKWWQYRWNEMLNADQVTAWMPLPEPYAERRTDGRD